MNKLIIPAIIGIFGLAPGTVTANAAESTTTSFSVQILKKKPKALKYGLKHGLKKGLKHGLKKGRINGGKNSRRHLICCRACSPAAFSHQ